MTKAIRIHANGGPEVMRLDDIDTGQPGPGQALIHNGAVGVNYIDVHCRTGRYPLPALPVTLGMEAAGTAADGAPLFRSVGFGLFFVVVETPWECSGGGSTHSPTK